MHPFLALWTQHHGTVPPRGWRLKHALPHRWLRIHTLPGSKRYADDASEGATIDERQRVAAAALFDDDAPVWLVTWQHGPSDISEPVTPDIVGAPLAEAGVLEENDATIGVMVARVRWSASGSAALRRAIAEDVHRAMWVHEQTAEVFAPYDGGVDLIFASVERRDLYAQRFSGWRSARHDGL